MECPLHSYQVTTLLPRAALSSSLHELTSYDRPERELVGRICLVIIWSLCTENVHPIMQPNPLCVHQMSMKDSTDQSLTYLRRYKALRKVLSVEEGGGWHSSGTFKSVWQTLSPISHHDRVSMETPGRWSSK